MITECVRCKRQINKACSVQVNVEARIGGQLVETKPAFVCLACDDLRELDRHAHRATIERKTEAQLERLEQMAVIKRWT